MMMMMNPKRYIHAIWFNTSNHNIPQSFVRAILAIHMARFNQLVVVSLHREICDGLMVFSPYKRISFDEYAGGSFKRSEAYTTIETYLSERISNRARGLKANFVKNSKSLVLGLADNEEVTDEYQGVKLWWNACKTSTRSQAIAFYPGSDDKRYYTLTFHASNRKFVTEKYLSYILDEGKAIKIKNRQRKLFTNVKEKSGSYYGRGGLWSHVEFRHPASFDTIGMKESKKNDIKNDLLRFRNSKDYYNKIGKPWKRGYLLYGPPGTGKSTMVVAIANLLEYDIYDLELTAVKDNTTLRQLLIETSGKSIIVIEDIDCSLDLTGERSTTSKNEKDKDNEEEDAKEQVKKKMKEEGENKKSEVTLSGLLNFIDGIWSAIGEERLIIFTTNHIEKLDKALIRRGRMDVHIELSYCCFESFKVLANNYLDIKSHHMFETIRGLLEEAKMNPADVAESLMPKSLELDVDACLENLVEALKMAKRDAQLKKEEEKKKMEDAKMDQQLKEEEEKRKKDNNEKIEAKEEGKEEHQDENVNVKKTENDD